VYEQKTTTRAAPPRSHVAFVYATASIFADIFHVVQEAGAADMGESKVVKQLAGMKPPKFKRDKCEWDTEDEDENKKIVLVRALKVKLLGLDLKKHFKLKAVEFEDSNHHIDFITAFSNLKAFNYYQIKPASKLKCKIFTGNIVPAIGN